MRQSTQYSVRKQIHLQNVTVLKRDYIQEQKNRKNRIHKTTT